MEKICLLLIFIALLCSQVNGADSLKKDIWSQLYALQDSSILDVKEGKYYLNAEKICILENNIFLNSDNFGPVSIVQILQDDDGIYTELYTQYMCDGCGKYYYSEPSVCSRCGSTSFSRSEALPDYLCSSL